MDQLEVGDIKITLSVTNDKTNDLDETAKTAHITIETNGEDLITQVLSKAIKSNTIPAFLKSLGKNTKVQETTKSFFDKYNETYPPQSGFTKLKNKVSNLFKSTKRRKGGGKKTRKNA